MMGAYLSARESADYCGVSEKTIRNWIAAGKLSAEKSAGMFRIYQEDLEPLRTIGLRSPQGAESASAEVRADVGPQGAESADISAGIVELVTLVSRLQIENRELATTAAIWQERARVLGDQLSLSAPQATIAAQPEPDPVSLAHTTTVPVWRSWWLLAFVAAGFVLLNLLLATPGAWVR